MVQYNFRLRECVCEREGDRNFTKTHAHIHLTLLLVSYGDIYIDRHYSVSLSLSFYLCSTLYTSSSSSLVTQDIALTNERLEIIQQIALDVVSHEEIG
jgi:hypothetical protein